MSSKIHVKHRETARVLLRNSQNQIFMLKTHFDPEVGLPPRWLIPGGGIDDGETVSEAAVRELFEETGLQIAEKDLGDPILITEGRWDWIDGKSFHTYKDTIYELVIDNFEMNSKGFTEDELRDILEYRWWDIQELVSSNESVGPHELKSFLAKNYI